MIAHARVPVGEVTLHVATAGEGPPVLLLHGFPDFWYGWRRLIPALRGFRAIAPDLRGYGESDRPPRIADYAREKLVGDAVGLLDALGVERAHVVGHDWGGGLAWWLAEDHPDRVDRLVVINCPHPGVLSRMMLRSPDQLRRSWYTLFFQLPGWPEAAVRKNLPRILQGSSNKAFTPEELEAYRRAFEGPLHGPIHWYRAAARHPFREPDRIRARTLLLWGERDVALGPQLVAPTLALCEDARVLRFPDLSHWPHLDDPARVNPAIVAFLSP
ncbi:MAG: alpha/beta fold hydrolase [Myxococcota bacterium]